jgi:hypothetical protein
MHRWEYYANVPTLNIGTYILTIDPPPQDRHNIVSVITNLRWAGFGYAT